MTRTFFAALAVAALFVPLSSLAQTDDNPQPGDSGSVYCPQLSIRLVRGMRDSATSNPPNQVTELQRFLSDYYEIDENQIVTGYFGPLTQRTVIRFQREQTLPAFGIVGELTRAAIARVCKTAPSYSQAAYYTQGNYQGTYYSQTSYYYTQGAYQGTYYAQANYYSQGSYSTTTPSFTTNPTNGPAPLAVNFSLVNGADGALYELHFGENDATAQLRNGGGALSNASRTYTNPGTYTATLTQVGGPSGPEQLVGTMTITVTAPQTTAPPTVTLTVNAQSAVTIPPGQTFTIAWSSSNATSCNLTNHLGQTGPTTPNTSTSNQGAAPAAGQTFTYTLACTNAGGTTTKTASVTGATTAPPPPPQANVGACMYKGQSYAEGQSVDVPITVAGQYGTFTCDNGVWSLARANYEIDTAVVGSSACDSGVSTRYSDAELSNLGCSTSRPVKALLSVNSRHGTAPLTVRINTSGAFYPPYEYTLQWGDGSTQRHQYLLPGSYSHTYSAAGTYTISYQTLWYDGSTRSNSANIRVDAAGTASAANQTQLASALTALEGAPKAILQLLQ